jgi:uncharacterized SAM-binding protein YcdF (DUF218 family)
MVRVAVAVAAVGALGAAAAAVFAPALLQAAGDFLVIRDSLEPADAVIAISGDGTGERAAAAAALVLAGYGRWLIVSGSADGAAAAMARVAMRAGVPEGRILVDDRAESTVQNARNSARLLRRHRLRRAILVTSPYHTRRAAMAFREEFRRWGLEVRVTATEHSFFDVDRWWTREFDRWLVTREYGKIAAFVAGIR